MKLHQYFVWLLLLFPVQAFATRERQSLEAFDRESLVVKAIYFNKSRGYSYAVVRDPGGYIHRAYRGDYLGKDFGRIVEISRKKGVRALEAVQDADGEWVQREVWIPFEKRLGSAHDVAGRDHAAMISHALLILGLLFPLISWLTLAGSWWTARRSGGHSSPVLVPFVGPLVLTWWLWQQGAQGWVFALPWVLDIGTVMFLCVLPRLVAAEWRTSRFTCVLALTGSQVVAQVRISLHSGGHYHLKKRWTRAPGELGTIALSESGTYVQGAAGSLELRCHAGKVRRLALDADHGYLVSDPGDPGDWSLDGWRLQASEARSL